MRKEIQNIRLKVSHVNTNVTDHKIIEYIC